MGVLGVFGVFGSVVGGCLGFLGVWVGACGPGLGLACSVGGLSGVFGGGPSLGVVDAVMLSPLPRVVDMSFFMLSRGEEATCLADGSSPSAPAAEGFLLLSGIRIGGPVGKVDSACSRALRFCRFSESHLR